jgi:hypothetical protein
MRTIALYGTVAAIITTALVLFTTFGGPRYSTEAFYGLRHAWDPPQRPGRLTPPGSHSASQDPASSPGTHFDFRRDATNYGLSESQCNAAFPDLFKEIERAVQYREKVGKMSVEELDVGWRGDGIVRAMIHKNRLYIIDAHGVWDHNHRPRSLATLNAINRAVTASSEPLPDIEFTFTDHDSALIEAKGNQTTWAYSRLAHQESLWLMPDFGFWGWPDVNLRSYSELQEILEEDEDDFLDKVPKLVWRGAMAVAAHDVRAGLIEHSKNQLWSDVQTLDWSNKTDIDSKLLSMQDHCGYMFTAQTEGNTNSGRLKYLLNCHSILMSHDLRFIEHFHHLLRDSGPVQNYVKLRRDFSDLPSKMESFLNPSSPAHSQVIADNALRTFRHRYLTPAAEACYWRALVRGWSSVQGFKPQVWEEMEVQDDWRGGKKSKKRIRGAPFESYAIMEEVEWEVPAKGRTVCVEE